MLMRMSLVTLLSAALCGQIHAEETVLTRAAEKVTLPLWPDGAPGAQGDTPADQPTLTVYLPPELGHTTAAVVICPGGGYGHLAIDYEGYEVAEWLNSLGVAGLVLSYRHAPGYAHPIPLGDAQRALRVVRANATIWRIDPKKVGILGFSAGGHLASTAATHYDSGKSDSTDPVDQLGCRPDFAILAYPVISLTTEYTHQGSKRNLLGAQPDDALVESLSSELQVTGQTPPTFLVHANDDRPVPPENSVLFYLALRKAEVSAEMHLYDHGGHGFGLGKKDPALTGWPILCGDWLRHQGFIPE